MSTGDLSYSLALLGSMGRSLTGLADAVEGTAYRTSWDAEEVGHRRVADALEHFADSWDDKRELLTRSLREVGEMATGAAQTFEQVDEELAREIRDVLEDR